MKKIFIFSYFFILGCTEGNSAKNTIEENTPFKVYPDYEFLEYESSDGFDYVAHEFLYNLKGNPISECNRLRKLFFGMPDISEVDFKSLKLSLKIKDSVWFEIKKDSFFNERKEEKFLCSFVYSPSGKKSNNRHSVAVTNNSVIFSLGFFN